MVGGCQACNMRFSSLDEMREHYTTDFHAANVRARVEGQAKMSAAEYRRRTMADDEKKPVFSCKLCKKQFHSVQTLQSHVKSTEHLMRKEQRIVERDSAAGSALTSTSLGSAALGLHRRHRAHMRARAKAKEHETAGRSLADAEAEAEREALLASGKTKAARRLAEAADAEAASPKPKVAADDREADITEARCLFCGYYCKTMRRNLTHMLRFHDFTIPLEERCTDKRGLLQYLSRKLNGLVCLVCGVDTKRYDSLEALRAHMAAANHERVLLSPEYNSFYEGSLDDGEKAEVPTVDGGSAALVVRGDKQRRVFRRDAQAARGMVRRLAETPQETEERRMITAAGHKDTQIILKELRKDTHLERKKHFKVMNQQQRLQKQFQLRVGIKKLWKKGYDGDGEMA